MSRTSNIFKGQILQIVLYLKSKQQTLPFLDIIWILLPVMSNLEAAETFVFQLLMFWQNYYYKTVQQNKSKFWVLGESGCSRLNNIPFRFSLYRYYYQWILKCVFFDSKFGLFCLRFRYSKFDHLRILLLHFSPCLIIWKRILFKFLAVKFFHKIEISKKEENCIFFI